MSKELFIFFAVIILLNIITFVMFYVDKRERHYYHGRGVSTHLFFTLAILGGSLGELLGMLCFHNKWHHKEYWIFLPIFLILQVICLVLYLNGYLSTIVISEELVPA